MNKIQDKIKSIINKSIVILRIYLDRIFVLFKNINIQNIQKLEQIILNLNAKHRAIFLFTIGLINFFASAPFNFFFILFVSFPIFFLLLNQSSENQKFKRFTLDIIFFIGGFSISQFNWLVVPLLTEWKFFILIPFGLLIAPIIFVVLNIFVFSFFYIISIFFNSKKDNNNQIIIMYNQNYILKIILFSLCYIFGEYIRGTYLFNGFQWQLFGNLFSNLFFIQILKFFNIYIYSFIYLIICFVGFLFYKESSDLDKKFRLAITGTIVAIILFALFTLIANPKKNDFEKINFVAGVQNNISAQILNKETSYQKITRTFADMQILGKMPQNSLLLMPEATFNISSDNYLQFFKILSSEIRQQNMLFISGAVFFDKVFNKIYNSIFFIDNGGNLIGHYKKQKLVPFGEYIPFRKFIPSFLKPITGESDFGTDGINDHVVLYRNFPLMFPLICYEIIFSEDVKKKLDKIKSRYYSNKEKIIINLTNDVWTGASISAYQHFRMARMTAVRANATLIRLSNNGISAIIDNKGRILTQTSLNEKTVLLSKI